MWVNVIPSKGNDILCKKLDNAFGFIKFECENENGIEKIIKLIVKEDYDVRFKFKSNKLNNEELFYFIEIENEEGFFNILTEDKFLMLSYGESSNLMRAVEAMIDLDIGYASYNILETFVNLPQNSQWFKYIVSRKKRNKRMVEKASSSNSMIIIYSLVLTILFDFLIGQVASDLRPLGINIAIFNILFLTCFFINNKNKIKKSILGLGFLILSLVTSFYFGIYNVAFIKWINVLLLPVINILLANALVNDFSISFRSLGAFLSETILTPFIFIKISFGKFKNTIKINKKEGTHRDSINAVIVGFLIFIPFAIILISLLSQSDLYFSQFISSIFSSLKQLFNFKNIGLEQWILRMLLMIWIFLYSVAVFLGTSDYKASPRVSIKKTISPLIIISFLISLLGLYTIYTLIQIPNLYINKNSIGALYSQYAREGFMQLVVVVIINFIIIAICSFLTRDVVSKYRNILKIQYTYLILLTSNMIISSNYKMNMYIDKYGFTRLRFSVKVGLAFLGIVFLLYIINIWRKIAFKHALIITLFVFCAFINIINVDGYIAKQNLEQYKVTKTIDIEYITEELSIDSLVEIKKVKDETAYSELKESFEQALRKRYKNEGFREFNINKYRLWKVE
ncbi:DUF4153 domain-containing protein [Clostridium sp. UBA1652]|uniref:DUF4153 domain-containing protein n=1 Tax=Clostridium sp. UBA1652 TaxID=1946348 RepID=UPI00257F13D4|nr:DUF4173 domain-containing protein [Clostridium sp. UBA1652]